MIKTFANIIQKFPDYHLYLCAEAENKELIDKYHMDIKNLGKERNVYFKGKIDRNAVPSVLKESAIITSVSNYEVVKYLCASDIAVLLRENVPMNNVAAPTKFAEYILTGLPVIISQNVGDFSNFVIENDLGLVFNNDFSITNFIKIHSYFNNKFKFYSNRRNEIAELGLNRYSKTTNINEIMAQYYSLIT